VEEAGGLGEHGFRGIVGGEELDFFFGPEGGEA